MANSERHKSEFFVPYVSHQTKCLEVTGVILAGGNSRRMKRNKAFLPFRGEFFIQRIHRQLSMVFDKTLLVTNTPGLYRFLSCSAVPDIYPGMGTLAGIHAGLQNSETPFIFVVACDMPHLNIGLIRHLIASVKDQQLVIPESNKGLEPLHAVYGKGALPVVEEALRKGDRKTLACCERLRSTVISRNAVVKLDPGFLSFRNINTPEDLFCFREEMKNVGGSERFAAQHGENFVEKLGDSENATVDLSRNSA